MLSDGQIERWSRQILLPDVGGRGQSRLLAARVGMLGAGAAADHAADLLRRAGVSVASGAPAPADVVIDLDGETVPTGVPCVRGRFAGAAGTVLTLVGRPCATCAPSVPLPAPARDGVIALLPASRVLAALVATEVIRVLLTAPPAGRRQRFDLLAGTFAAEPLSGPGCAACGSVAG